MMSSRAKKHPGSVHRRIWWHIMPLQLIRANIPTSGCRTGAATASMVTIICGGTTVPMVTPAKTAMRFAITRSLSVRIQAMPARASISIAIRVLPRGKWLFPRARSTMWPPSVAGKHLRCVIGLALVASAILNPSTAQVSMFHLLPPSMRSSRIARSSRN